jgi:hypothetical protein
MKRFILHPCSAKMGATPLFSFLYDDARCKRRKQLPNFSWFVYMCRIS